jgi:hypothetical protein
MGKCFIYHCYQDGIFPSRINFLRKERTMTREEFEITLKRLESSANMTGYAEAYDDSIVWHKSNEIAKEYLQKLINWYDEVAPLIKLGKQAQATAGQLGATSHGYTSIAQQE